MVVAIALALNLARITLSIAQTGEDTMRARVAAASTALRGQLDLLDARAAPRAVAMMPDLIEAVRGEERQPPPRPDERALRAAASVLSPEPDLFAVVTPQGAIVSRRARPAQVLDDPAQLPLAQTASGGLPTPTFASFDNAVYRFAGARVPGATAAAVVGALVDDRLAAQLKSQVDADVTLLQNGRILASSLPQGEERARLLRWAAAPAPGYGVLPVRLPLVGAELSGKLPRWAMRYAVRGALIPLDSGVQAALTVPASPYLSWLGRYQAFYLLGLALLVIFGFVWGLLERAPRPVVQQVVAPPPEPEEPEDGVVSPPRRAPRTPSLVGADIGEPRVAASPVRDVPWSPGEGPSGEHPVPAAEAPDTVPSPLPPTFVEAAAAGEVERESATVREVPAGAAAGVEEAQASAGNGKVEALSATEGPSWAAPPAAAAVPDWQMPSLPPDALAGAPQEKGPALGQILDPLVGPPASSELSAPEPLGEPAGPAATEAGTETPEAAPAEAGAVSAGAVFPGDEPTRQEAVSAALIDKLRERDEEQTPVSEPPQVSEPPPDANVTLQDVSMPGMEASDPDELHWRETYDRFRELKAQLGEPADRLSFERFAAKLKRNRADLLAKHNCKGVRFSVYEKDGRAAIKASAIR